MRRAVTTCPPDFSSRNVSLACSTFDAVAVQVDGIVEVHDLAVRDGGAHGVDAVGHGPTAALAQGRTRLAADLELGLVCHGAVGAQHGQRLEVAAHATRLGTRIPGADHRITALDGHAGRRRLGRSSGLASVMAAGFPAAQPARIRATPNAPAIRKYRLLMNSSTRPPTRRADPRRAPRATNIRHSKEGKMKNQRRLLRPRAPSAIAQQSSWRGASFSAGTRKMRWFQATRPRGAHDVDALHAPPCHVAVLFI